MEHQDIAENVRALRDELRDLADFLHRPTTPVPPVIIAAPVAPPSPAPVVVVQTPTPMPASPRVVRLDARVGSSSVMSSLYPLDGDDVFLGDRDVALDRSNSNVSGYSFLSSAHSDDFLYEDQDEEEEQPQTPQTWQPATIAESTSSIDDESTTSSSVVSSSTMSQSSSSSGTTVRPPDVLDTAMRTIHDQLRSLADKQVATLGAIADLQNRELPQPEDHTPELTDRLRRIEDLIQAVIEQGHPKGLEIPVVHAPPVVPPAAPPTTTRTERTESVTDSDDSLERLARILGDLASPGDIPHMPTPMAVHPNISMARQLDEILTSANLPSAAPLEAPSFVPFTYQPAEHGDRVRSPSILSMETLPRPATVPIVFNGDYPPPPPPVQAGRRRTIRSDRRPHDPHWSYVPEDIPPPSVPPRAPAVFLEQEPQRERQRPRQTFGDAQPAAQPAEPERRPYVRPPGPFLVSAVDCWFASTHLTLVCFVNSLKVYILDLQAPHQRSVEVIHEKVRAGIGVREKISISNGYVAKPIAFRSVLIFK